MLVHVQEPFCGTYKSHLLGFLCVKITDAQIPTTKIKVLEKTIRILMKENNCFV